MDKISSKIIEKLVLETLAFIEKNGTNTFDPFDLIGTPFGIWVTSKRTPLTFVLRQPFWFGMLFAPLVTRRILKTERRATPGGIANLISLYTLLGEGTHIQKARENIDWLLANATQGDNWIGWGFPYTWVNKKIYPAGTPISHGTMTCGNALYRYYLKTRDEDLIAPLTQLCNFFDVMLNKSFRKSGSVALSYTPSDTSQVINIQADLASLLLRIGTAFNIHRFTELSQRMVECVLESQNPDGSWYYHTFDSINAKSIIDNHHTGMVLSALVEISDCLRKEDILQSRLRKSITLGSQFFMKELFTESGVPKWSNESIYPVDIYNFAQSIITLLDLRRWIKYEVEHIDAKLNSLLIQLHDQMYKDGGGFLYRRTRFTKQDLSSLRWADALTTFSLCRCLKELYNIQIGQHADTRLAEI